MPTPSFLASLRKTKAQTRRRTLFVSIPTQTWAYLALLLSLSQGFGCFSSEQQVPPFLPPLLKKKGGEIEFDFICVEILFVYLFACLLLLWHKMPGQTLDTGLLFSDRKMINFRGQTTWFEGNSIRFSLCFQALISNLQHKWRFTWILSSVSFYFPLLVTL